MNQSPNRRHRRRIAIPMLTLGLLASACGESEEETSAPEETTAESTAAGGSEGGVLAGVCPDTIVIQTDWEPESEHGALYQLVGEGYTIDADKKAVTGPLVAGGEDTGVDVEVRIGGGAIGFTPVQALMYTDTDIFLGMTRLTEAMASYKDTPTAGVLAMFEKSPIAFYWDPETYPEAESVADLPDDTTIMMGRPDVFIDWMIKEGVISESQADLSESPKPATFVAAGGKLAELGFITAEPFLYEFEVPEWGKPVKSELLHDIGFPEYFQALSVREKDLSGEADCLEVLVPIIQQSLVDYYADPAETNDLIIELVDTYDTGWVYTLPAAEFSAKEQIEAGIISNGDNSSVGDFDEARIETLIGIIDDVTDADVTDIDPKVLATNQFLDDSIGL